MKKHTIFYSLLFASTFIGICTAYFPDVWGMPPAFWLSELIETFSYFTIISNTAVLLLAGSQLFYAQTAFGLWMSRTTVQTAIAVYITMTALIYHGLLSNMANLEGLALVSDIFVHSITPGLYALFWWLCVRGKPFKLAQTLPTLIVPAAFLLYWLVRGSLIGRYPYFFMDLNEHGAFVVGFNLFGLGILFWLLAAFYWALAKFTTPLYV